MGYDVLETQISRFDLISSDEVWMTGTAAEIAPVTCIDGRPIGTGKIGEVSQKIHARFHDIATGKVPEYECWLDYVN
jgi:branched-chain amino acid aminotransferase